MKCKQFVFIVDKIKAELRKPVQLVFGNLGDAQPKDETPKKPEAKTKAEIAAQLAKLGEEKPEDKKEGGAEKKDKEEKEGKGEKEGKATILEGEKPNDSADCKQGPIAHNVTLKGGRKAGEFKEIPHAKDMKDCIAQCCEQKEKKCNLAFMLSNACYAVTCKSKESCATIPAPPSGFHPQIAMVREPVQADTGVAKIGGFISIMFMFTMLLMHCIGSVLSPRFIYIEFIQPQTWALILIQSFLLAGPK